MRTILCSLFLSVACLAQVQQVKHGGTGDSTLLQYGILVGDGINPINLVTPSDNSVPLWQTAASYPVATAIPLCVDTGGQHLNYDSATHTFSCGTSGTPEGVTSLSASYPIVATPDPITSTGSYGCPDCVTSPGVNTVGGIAGGYSNVGSSSTGSLFSPWDAATSTVRVITPTDSFYRNLGVYVVTAPTISPNWLSFVRTTTQSNSTDVVSDAGRLMVPAGAAAGVYHEYAGATPFHTAQGLVSYMEQWSPSSSAGFGITIAGYSWDTTTQLLVHAINSKTIAGSTTVYGGPGQYSNATLNDGTESNTTVFMPCSGTIKNLCMMTASSQPAGGGLSCTLRLLHSGSYSSTSLTATVAASGVAQEKCDVYDVTGHSQTVVAGDGIDFDYTNASGSTSAQLSSCGVEFVASDSCTGMVIFNRELTTPHYAATAGAAGDFVMAFAGGTHNFTEAQTRAPMPSAAKLGNMHCSWSSPPTVKNLAITLVANGSDSTLTVPIATTDVCASPPCDVSDLVHTVSFSQWDNFDLKFAQDSTGGPTIAQVNNCSVGRYAP